ncbi:hypothetical protein V6N11_043765 [Hibiscus sabdariffa]|uniref:Secreted protein n=1 Tax=Hibiscus sabdariffa TaxID=183260 RepID=A0ABR2RDJ8_9ROSI
MWIPAWRLGLMIIETIIQGLLVLGLGPPSSHREEEYNDFDLQQLCHHQTKLLQHSQAQRLLLNQLLLHRMSGLGYAQLLVDAARE